MFRGLLDSFEPGDIVLGDRLFGTYYDMARLKQRGVDGIFRMNAHRKTDFRRGRRLGPEDHVVVWKKPAQRPAGISQEEFAALPPELLELPPERLLPLWELLCEPLCDPLCEPLIPPLPLEQSSNLISPRLLH